MRKFAILLVATLFAGCGGGGGGDRTVAGGGGATGTCTIDEQKNFVLDVMRDWYLWNDRLPANVNIDDFGTPTELLNFLTSFSPEGGNGNPVDVFSSLGSAQSDAEFFGEGRFEGYGFVRRTLSDGSVFVLQVYEGSPAALGGIVRGQEIIALNDRTMSDVQANEGVGALLSTSPLKFTLRQVNGAVFSVTLARDVVTIDPVPQWRIIDTGFGRKVGYLEMRQFISTADAKLDAAFEAFASESVNDIVLDLRYNGGGLVSTAELLGDLLGGFVAENLPFSKTIYNADRGPANNRTSTFSRRTGSTSTVQLVVIATRGTASASELVTNGLDPHVNVTIVGDSTFGKPIGQSGFVNCDEILRATSFQTVNADDFGDFFDGLPVDCPASDDIAVPIGADSDPNLVTALSFIENNACPVVSLPGGQTKPGELLEIVETDRRGPPWRVYADAF